MNRTEAKELLPVITAFAEGAEVEINDVAGGWQPVAEPTFNPFYKYRIVPKPKTCERWCFAAFLKDGGSTILFRDTEAAAKKTLDNYKITSSATFSSIVRVEFVETLETKE